jgi:excisionase family DNA binding protein
MLLQRATIAEAAGGLGISTDSLCQAVRTGHMPSLRLGRKWLVLACAATRLHKDE